MKLLLISGSFPPMRCGVGDYAERLATALHRDFAIEVTVLTSALDMRPAETPGIEVMRVMPTWHRSARERFETAMRRLSPDVVHIQFPTQGYDFVNGLALIALSSRLRWRVPVVVTLHEFLPRIRNRSDRWTHTLALVANRLVVVRPNYHATLPWPTKLLVPERKVQFVANASVVPRVSLSEPERDAVKRGLGCDSTKLVAFFGFSYPHKGVDLLFEIADPAKHHLLLIGELSPTDPYHARLRALAESGQWKGRVTITGFVEASEAGRLLAAADAAVFPHRGGGGSWNSSLHAASSQGTFVLTTSAERNGYDADANIYYAQPDAVDEMRRALLTHQGVRRAHATADQDPWREIARVHAEIYRSLLPKSARAWIA